MEIRITKILCPVDYSGHSNHALMYAEMLAEKYQAQLYLLHVIEPHFTYGTSEAMALAAPSPEHLLQTAKGAMEDLVKTRMAGKLGAKCMTVEGKPFVEICKMAREENIDLIVIGSHGRSGVSHMLIGSVAEKVVRKAPCPVLVVKMDEHEFVMP